MSESEGERETATVRSLIRSDTRSAPFPKELYSLSPEDQASNESPFGFLLHPPSSFDSPAKLSSAGDISRYEWGAAGTIFPSSCYPVSFFAAVPPTRFIFRAEKPPQTIARSRIGGIASRTPASTSLHPSFRPKQHAK